MSTPTPNDMLATIKALRAECAQRRIENRELLAANDRLERRNGKLAQELLKMKGELEDMRKPHPLAQIAANMHKPVTIGGDIIDGPDGTPIAVTESVTAPVIGMVITEREATEAGIQHGTPGVTIVNNETGALISRGRDLED